MTKEELQARFPYMFEGPNIGLDLCDGWLPILTVACEKVDAILGPDKAGFFFHQIKEKYGGARFYFGGSATMTEEIWKAIQAVLDNAETATETACMRCGAPAQIELYGTWYACLCQVHAEERRSQKRGAGSF